MNRPLLAAALAAGAPLLAVSCGTSEASSTLRFTGIPDSDKAALEKRYEAVTAYLADELGMDVEYIHVPDYNGAVTALAANKVDFVWLGGVTSIESEDRTDGEVAFIASRAKDLQFKTYFIANQAVVDAGALAAASTTESAPTAELAALKDAFAGLSFTFGSKSSTSGHIMPRHFLGEAGIDPENDFARAPGFQLQGGHSATLAQVASGAVDVGALSYATWESADAETKANAPVVYVTPTYVDYCMVAHTRIGEELVQQLRDAFSGLDASVPEQAAVLSAFSAESFVPADPANWDPIREVLEAARVKGVLD